MALRTILGVVYLLGAIGLFILVPVQWRAGKKKHFWLMLALGIVFLSMAIANL
jgi:hypothetical protein